MGKSRTGVKCILAANLAAMIGFALLFSILPIWTEVQVKMKYVNLDRAGVIDANALAKFHPSYDFTKNPRIVVPLYIAGPALDAQSSSALGGFILALTNVVLTVWVLLKDRRPGGSPKSAA